MNTKRGGVLDVIGKPIDRVDGKLKVTGKAKYAAEYAIENLAYGVVVQSTIAKGTIRSIDASKAEKLPGVVAVFSCMNKPITLKKTKDNKADHLFLFQDAGVRYAGQIIALVVADTFEIARHAASLVEVSYKAQPAKTKFEDSLTNLRVPPHDAESKRGNFAKGLAEADVKVEETYNTPAEHHNPMEPFATIAHWQGDSLTLYDTTQGIFPTQATVADILSMPPDKVRIISRFVGGGFGCKLTVWPQVMLAAMAAKKTNRPVKVVLARTQMYGPVGFRPHTRQSVALGANKSGKLTAIRHEGISETCTFKDFLEVVASGAKVLYSCPNVETKHRIVRIDVGEPTWMRAPGHAPGSFALESALDELAYKLNIDPLELRLLNYSDKDEDSGLPWSEISLRECYRQGAERFGWSKRSKQPGSMRDGNQLIGMGMATATHGVWRNPASASAKILEDGSALVQSGSQDIGTGTYTIMTQIAAECLSLPLEKVKFELGDTNLPHTPLSGGSTTAGSVGPAVALACSTVMKKLVEAAISNEHSALYGVKTESVAFENGKLVDKDDPTRSESYQSVVSRTRNKSIEAKVETKIDDKESKYAMSTFGAQFAEVRVDKELGTVHVSRFVGAYGAGRILNAKTARSQILGGITFGIGMALTEETHIDHNLGRIINADLAEYHLPVHADIGDIDVIFVDEKDPHVNTLGAKGIGELGITGAAAAIANAVYNATGKRIRDLPITLDKLL